jgi:hypothetical protein
MSDFQWFGNQDCIGHTFHPVDSCNDISAYHSDVVERVTSFLVLSFISFLSREWIFSLISNSFRIKLHFLKFFKKVD